MNRAFLEQYNRELQILYERSKQFAEEFPGVAERLGGLSRETMDPGIASLLQGSAFMAARVQLKLKSEFAQFTSALLDQLLPNFLAPIPRRRWFRPRRNTRIRHWSKDGASRAATISTPSMSRRSAASPAASGCAATSSCGRCISIRRSTTQHPRRCRRSAST